MAEFGKNTRQCTKYVIFSGKVCGFGWQLVSYLAVWQIRRNIIPRNTLTKFVENKTKLLSSTQTYPQYIHQQRHVQREQQTLILWSSDAVTSECRSAEKHNLLTDALWPQTLPTCIHNTVTLQHGWLKICRVVSVLDSGAVGPGFKSQPRCCQVTVLGKLFTPIVPLSIKQRNW